MKLQLKRSLKTLTNSTVAQGPSADQMEYGELAVNYVHSDPSLFLKDSTNAIRKLQLSIFPDTSNASSQTGTLDERYLLQSGGSLTGNVEAPSFIGGVARMSTVAPASAEDGELWWNSNDGRLYVYYDDGSTTQWVDASPDSFTLGAGYYDKNESDARYLKLTGGVVGGSVNFNGAIDASSISITGQNVDTGAQVDAKVATLQSSVNTSLAGKADLSGADFTGGLSIAGFLRGGDNNILYIGDDIELSSGKSLRLGGGNTKLSNDGTAFTVDIFSTEMFRVTDSGVNVFGNAIDLNANGSASFAGGDLTINNSGNLVSQRSGSAGFVQLNSTGWAKIRGAASAGVFTIEDSASGTTKATINGDGSASFAGTVDAAGLTVNGAPVTVDLSAYDTSAQVDAKIAAIPATDLSSYDTSAQVDAKIAAIPSTDLSSYDTSAQVDAKIAAIPATDLSSYDTSAQVDAKIAAIPSTDLSGYDTSAEVTAKVAALETTLTDGAPGALNTLNELAAALGDDANFASTVTNSLAGKADLSGAATFAGTVQATDGTQYVKAYETGFVQANRTNGGNYVFEGRLSNSTTSFINGDGFAWFNSNIQTGGDPNNASADGIKLFSAGACYASRSSGNDDLFVGYQTGNTTPAIRLKANGSATFAGTTTVGSNPDETSNSGCKLFASGTIRTRSTSSTSSGILFEGFGAGQSSAQFKVTADGSATFSGRIDAGSSTLDNAAIVASANHATKGAIQAYHYNNGSVWVAGGADGVTKSEIKADGSATFSGTVAVNAPYNQNGIAITAGAAGYSSPLVVSNANGDDYFEIAGDGAATIAGDVTIGGYNGSSSTTDGVLLGAVGGVYSQLAAATAGTGVVFQGMHGASATSVIKANGSATFDGAVAVGNTITSSSNVDGATIYNNGTTYISRSGANNLIVGRQTGTSGNKVVLNADGSATFAGPQTLATPSSPATNGYTAHVNNTEASTAACFSANNHNAHGINFLGVDGGNSNAITCKIMNDGSATFSGTVAVNAPYNQNGIAITAGAAGYSSPLVVSNANGDDYFEIAGDGAATFAGGVTATGDDASSGITVNTTAAGKGVTVLGSTGGDIRLKGNGSATFSGKVDIGSESDPTSGVGLEVICDHNVPTLGALVAKNKGTGPSIVGRDSVGYDRFRVENDGGIYSYGDSTFVGSATFSGTVDAAALTINGASVDTSTQVDAKINGLASVAASGSYSDLSDKPSISNSTIQFITYGQGAGTSTFSLNQAGNSTLTIPQIRYSDLSGAPDLSNYSGNINAAGSATFAGGNAFDAANSTFASDLVIGDGNGNHGLTIFTDGNSDGILNFARGTTGDDRWRGTIRYDHNDARFNFMVEYGIGTNPCAQIGNDFIWTRGSLQARNGYVYLGAEDVADGVISSRESVGILIDSNTTTNETERFFVRTGGSNDLFSVYESGNAYVTGIMQANGYSFSNLQELV